MATEQQSAAGFPSLATLNPSALVPVAQPGPTDIKPGAARGLSERRAARRAHPYRRQPFHNEAKRVAWDDQSKATVAKAVDAGILRFEDVEEYNDETGETDAYGIAAKFHAWEFQTLDDDVDYDPWKHRFAYYPKALPHGPTTWVPGDVSYPKDLLYKSKDALKNHKNPTFFYHPAKEGVGGVWFCDEVEWPDWLHRAVKARHTRKAAERVAQIAKAEAAEDARKARLAERKRLEAEEAARKRELERARIATLEAAAARAARRAALIQQLRQTGTVAAADRQWFRETFAEGLERAVATIVLKEHDDHVKKEFARIPASSIAKAPDLVDARLVPLEMYVLDNVVAIVDKIVAAFKRNNLHPITDAIKYTAKARARLTLPEVGECATLYVRTQPSKAAKVVDTQNESAAITWSLLFDPNSNVRGAVNAELLAHDYQKGVLRGGEQIQVTSVQTLRGALNGLWNGVFSPETKENAALWDLPRRVDEDGPNAAFAARLPNVDFSDVPSRE
jgi:hypothetical protein